jgi:hypothetical protein
MAKQKQPKHLDKIDLDAIYLCNMVIKGTKEEELAEVKIQISSDNKGYNIIPLNRDRYDTKFFYDLYIDWLLYTKYIVKKEG